MQQYGSRTTMNKTQLETAFTRYGSNSFRVRQEILNLWQKYPSLSPKEDYLDEEGTFGTKLILMEGTIPVNYKSILYHFPISIFVPSNYPTISPICYVSPTNDMDVKQGHLNLDNKGKVHSIPYSTEWNETHSLIGFIAALTSLFEQNPPVFSKFSSHSSAPSTPVVPTSSTKPSAPPAPPLIDPFAEEPKSTSSEAFMASVTQEAQKSETSHLLKEKENEIQLLKQENAKLSKENAELKAKVDNLTLKNSHFHGHKLETLSYDELRGMSVVLKATILKVEAELVYKQEIETRCCICLEHEKDTIIHPCSHLKICHECAKPDLKKCPFCNGPVYQFQRVFT